MTSRSIDSATGLLYTERQSASGIDLLTAVEDRALTPVGSRWLRPDYGSRYQDWGLEPDERVDSLRRALAGDARVLGIDARRAGDALDVEVRGRGFAVSLPAAGVPLIPVTPITPAVPLVPITPAMPPEGTLLAYWGISALADDLSGIDLTTTTGVVSRSDATGDWTIAGIPDDGQLYRPYVLAPHDAPGIIISQPPFAVREAYTVHAYAQGDDHYVLYRYTAEARVSAAYNGAVLHIAPTG